MGKAKFKIGDRVRPRNTNKEYKVTEVHIEETQNTLDVVYKTQGRDDIITEWHEEEELEPVSDIEEGDIIVLPTGHISKVISTDDAFLEAKLNGDNKIYKSSDCRKADSDDFKNIWMRNLTIDHYLKVERLLEEYHIVGYKVSSVDKEYEDSVVRSICTEAYEGLDILFTDYVVGFDPIDYREVFFEDLFPNYITYNLCSDIVGRIRRSWWGIDNTPEEPTENDTREEDLEEILSFIQEDFSEYRILFYKK